MENNFNVTNGEKHIHSLEDLKTLPTGMLLLIRDDLTKAKLKTQKAYKFCTVKAVLGSGLVILGVATGAIFSSILGGLVIAEGITSSAINELRGQTYDQIINFIDDEISYRELGKEAFPEFYEEKKTILDLFYPREM